MRKGPGHVHRGHQMRVKGGGGGTPRKMGCEWRVTVSAAGNSSNAGGQSYVMRSRWTDTQKCSASLELRDVMRMCRSTWD